MTITFQLQVDQEYLQSLIDKEEYEKLPQPTKEDVNNMIMAFRVFNDYVKSLGFYTRSEIYLNPKVYEG